MSDKKWRRVPPSNIKEEIVSNSMGFVLYQNKLIPRDRVVPPFFYIVDKYFDISTPKESTAVIFHVGATIYHVALPIGSSLMAHREHWGGPIRVHTRDYVFQKFAHLDITYLKKKDKELGYVT